MNQYYEIKKQLQKYNIKVIQKGINLLNYIEIIQNISKIIRDERKNNPNTEILINLSVGTNITSIAAMDACRFWECTPYYVIGEKYIPQNEITKETRSLSSGKMDVFAPPVFKIIKPKPNHIEALKIIAERKTGIYKKNFRKELLRKNLLVIQKKYDKPNDPKRLSAEYMAMNQQYIYPLRDTWKYIKISDAKRNQKIILTKNGEEIVQIFHYLS